MSEEPMERDAVTIPDDPQEAFERIIAAFPWIDVTVNKKSVRVKLPDGETLKLAAGDVLRFDPERGYWKDTPPDWAKMEADRKAAEQRWRNEQAAKRDARLEALIGAGHGAVVDAMDSYVRSDEHSHSCAGYSEGQGCCLDPDHEQFGEMLAVILTALKWGT